MLQKLQAANDAFTIFLTWSVLAFLHQIGEVILSARKVLEKLHKVHEKGEQTEILVVGYNIRKVGSKSEKQLTSSLIESEGIGKKCLKRNMQSVCI